MTLPLSQSDFDCIDVPRNTFFERDFLNSRSTESFVNMSKQKLHAPCFNASFPTSLTVEEGKNVILPCVVHNVDFNNIVMSWWKERALREIAVGDNISDRRFSIDKSIQGGWSLRIENVSLLDSGVYICQINSKQLREKFIYLSVTAKQPPRFHLPTNDVLVKDEAMHPGQVNRKFVFSYSPTG
nr:defective proboscis extension response [Hymenolepis microstoma]